MKTSERIKIFESLYHPFTHDIETDTDLKRVGITFCEYNQIIDILKQLSGIKGDLSADTISHKVADIFRSHGFTVKEKGIGFCISFE